MDMRISEVVVTLDRKWENDLAGALEILKKHGLEVTCADDDNSVVEGTIEQACVHTLEKLEPVRYVRTVFTYDAEFPPGHPRDRNCM